MLIWIRKLVAAPVFEDKEQTRVVGLLNTILLTLLMIMTLVISLLSVVDPSSAVFNLPIGVVMAVVSLGLLFLTRRGYVQFAGLLLSSALLVVTTATTYIFGGVRSSSAMGYFLVVTIAGLLLGGRAAVIFGMLSMAAALGAFYAEIRGAIVIPMPASVGFVDWFLLSTILGVESLLLRFAVRSIAEGFKRARQEIIERQRAEDELREHRDHLEELVGERTAELRRINEELEQEIAERARTEELLKELFKMTQQAKEEWESTVDSLSELICLVDDRGHIIRANRTVETWKLGTVVDVKGRGVHEALHPGCTDALCSLDSCWKRAWQEAARGEPAQCEVYDEFLKRHILIRVQPWRGAAVGSTVVVVQDITVRKQSEEALKEYSERLEEMVGERTDELKTINEQLRLEITERERAEEALVRRAVQLATLNRIGRRVASTLDQQKLLQDAVDAVREDLGYLQAAVLLVDEEASELYVAVATDNFWEIVPDEYRQPVGKGAIGIAVETEETVLVCDAASDSRVYRAGYWFSPSSLSVPIGIGGQVIGVLEVEADVPNAFDENDQATLEIMADQIAIAIENARLYAEIEERRLYLEGVLRAAPDAIVTLDARHQIVEWNSGAQRLFGYSREEAIGHDLDDLITSSDILDEAIGFTQVVSGGGELLPVEVVRYRKDGSLVDVIVAGSSILVGEKVIGIVAVYTDITERKRAEEGLKRRNRELATLYEATTAISSDLSLDVVLQAVAEQMTQVLGSNGCALSLWRRDRNLVETLVDYNENWPDETDPPGTTYDLDDYPTTLRVLETTRPLALRFGDPAADPTELALMEAQDVRTLLMLPLIARDRVVGLMELTDDLEAREYTPEQLRLAESLAAQAAIAIENARLYGEIEERRMYLEAVLRAAPDAIVALDARHLIVEWNSGAERLLGYSREEAIGHNVDDLITDPDVLEEAVGLTQIVMGGGEVPPLETVRYRKDGSPVDVIVAGSPILMGDEFIGVVAVYSDITDRKRAEEALRDEKALMDALMDNVTDSIYFKDRQCCLVRINRKMMRDLNLDEMSQAIGKTDVDLFGEEFGKKTLAEDQRIVATGEPLIGLIESRKLEDGQINWTLTTKVPLRDASGQIVGLAGITREINELMRAEQSLRESKERLQRYAVELEQANEEVKQFAYVVSHDLRAPLVNLKGFSAELRFSLEAVDAAMDTVLPHLDEKRRRDVTLALEEDIPEALGFIESSVTRMDHFIQALLKLSRLGRRELHLETVDVEALVQATLQTLSHQIEERRGKVTVGPLPEVVADHTSMEQIMGNLLGNAVKYLDPERAAEIEITAERGEEETIFQIRDNGRGIAEEDMPKVFAPFRRIGRQDVPGEGMGLPYVQALVRRHGGRIWCESELGVGTTFSFTIPNNLTIRGQS